MNWKKLVDLQGLNLWLLVSAMALSFILTGLVFLLAFGLMEGSSVTVVQGAIILGVFVVNFFNGWFSGKIYHDNRGPSYGLLGSMGSVVLLAFTALSSGGLFGVMAIVIAMAGGLNGGIASLPRRPSED